MIVLESQFDLDNKTLASFKKNYRKGLFRTGRWIKNFRFVYE